MLKLIRERKELMLVMGLPIVSVLMGIVIFVAAYGGGNPEIVVEAPTLSKTSWRAEQ